MSRLDKQMRGRLIKANEKIKNIQRELQVAFVGKRVKLLTDRRGAYSRRKYKPGTEFILYDVVVDGRDIALWLSRVEDEAFPCFELSVWLREVEFIKEPK